MEGGKANDVDIIKVKKKKKNSTVKKNVIPSKIKQKSKVTPDANDLSAQKKINFNLENEININMDNDYKNIKNWKEIESSLKPIQEMIIKQESDILEAVTGCQEPNNYYVYGKLPNDEKSYIFKCREFSSCGMRFCCPVSCRELIMKIKIASNEKEPENNEEQEQEQEQDQDEEYNDSLFYIEKKFKCPCCNCIRPEMKIFITETNALLGTIEEGFSCCDPIFNVYDKDGKLIYFIETDCCQCGFVCRNNCLGKTDECVFFIYDNETKSNPIGEISKGAVSSQLTIGDNYSVIFPKKASIIDKILLTITGVMIDYQYFENNTNTAR